VFKILFASLQLLLMALRLASLINEVFIQNSKIIFTEVLITFKFNKNVFYKFVWPPQII